VKRVLILHSDLGFVLWLGQALSDAGYEAFPATGVGDATGLISELTEEIHLLIVDPTLAGAIDLVDSLRRSQRDLKVIALLDDEDKQAGRIPRPDIRAHKPGEANAAASAWWVRTVGQLLFRDCAA
jgi:DNA-binding response OmpR family regulator